MLCFFITPLPPRSTLTDTLLPHTTLFRAQVRRAPCVRPPAQECQSVMRLNQHPAIRDGEIADASRRQHTSQLGKMRQLLRLFTDMFDHMVGKNDVQTVDREGRSAERSVGKEWASTCRSWWAP